MAEVSSQTLHIVARELASELNEARASLEAFGEQQENLALLRKCNEHLHAVHGALRVAEVYGAALLAEEMGQVAHYLIANFDEKRHLAEGLDALMRAMVQLPTYLERVMSGGRDMALVLLPLLNDLRAVRGHALLSEGTLLLLNLSSDQQANPVSGLNDGLTVAQWARKLRTRYQLGLLGWIKGERVDQNLEILSRTAEKLEHVATTQAVFQLWWVVGAVLEALREGGLDSSASVKRLLGQADREMKRLYESGEARYSDSPPLELLNNLLYYVARARTNGPRVAAVRASFRLSELLPVDEGVEQARESLSAPSVKLMKTVAAAIKEDLSRVKDALDIFVRQGGTQVDELAPQLDLLKKIADTLGVLGLGELRDKVQAETTDLQAIVAQKSAAGEGTLLRMAATLIKVEDSLDEQLVGMIVPTAGESGTAPVKPTGPDDIEFRQVTEAVLRECIVNMARIKEAIAHSLDKPRDGAAVDQIPQLMRGITAGLLMLGKTRVVEIMEGIDKALANFLRNDGMTLPQEAVDRLADAIVAVEYYMETIQAGRADPWYMLDNAEACLRFLAETQPVPRLDAFPSTPDHARTVVIETHAPTFALGTEHEPTAVLDPVTQEVRRPSRPAAAPQPPAAADPMPPALAKPVDREVDPEFVELFIEEAKDEIAKLNQFFPLWDTNPQDQEALVNVRRSFHTLKGSGRMVGAQLIGDFAWSIENMLNRVINKTLDRTPDMMGLMRSAVAAVPELVEQLETGRAPAADIAKIINTANTLAGVRPSPAPAPAAAAAPSPAASASPVPPPNATMMEPPKLQPLPEKKTDSEALASEAGSADSPMDPGLHEIYAKETAGHLATIHKFISDCQLAHPPYTVTEDLHRSCHTLSGTAKTAGARQGIKIAEPLNRYIRKLFDNSIGMPRAGLVALRESVNAIQNVVDNINESTGFFADHDRIVQRLVDLEHELDAEISRVAEMGAHPTAGGTNMDATGEHLVAPTGATSINEQLVGSMGATSVNEALPAVAAAGSGDEPSRVDSPAAEADETPESVLTLESVETPDAVDVPEAVEIEDISLSDGGLPEAAASAESDTAGGGVSESATSGLETTGSETPGPETTGPETTGPETIGLETTQVMSQAEAPQVGTPRVETSQAETPQAATSPTEASWIETTRIEPSPSEAFGSASSEPETFELSPVDPSVLAAGTLVLPTPSLDASASAESDGLVTATDSTAPDEITLQTATLTGDEVNLAAAEIAIEDVDLDAPELAIEGVDLNVPELTVEANGLNVPAQAVEGINRDVPELTVEENTVAAANVGGAEPKLDATADEARDADSADAIEEITLGTAEAATEEARLDATAGEARDAGSADAVEEITLGTAESATEETKLDAPQTVGEQSEAGSAGAVEEITLGTAEATAGEIKLDSTAGEARVAGSPDAAEEIILGTAESATEGTKLDAPQAAGEQSETGLPGAAIEEISLETPEFSVEEINLETGEVAGEEIILDSAAPSNEEAAVGSGADQPPGGVTETAGEEIVLGSLEVTPEEITLGESADDVIEIESDARALDTLQWAYDNFPVDAAGSASNEATAGEVQVDEAELSGADDLAQEAAALEALAKAPDESGIVVEEGTSEEPGIVLEGSDRAVLQLDEPLPEEARDIMVDTVAWAIEHQPPAQSSEPPVARDDAETIRTPFLRPTPPETLQTETPAEPSTAGLTSAEQAPAAATNEAPATAADETLAAVTSEAPAIATDDTLAAVTGEATATASDDTLAAVTGEAPATATDDTLAALTSEATATATDDTLAALTSEATATTTDDTLSAVTSEAPATATDDTLAAQTSEAPAAVTNDAPAASAPPSDAAPVAPATVVPAAVEEDDYDDSDFDPDVAAIFTEEATELLETADQSLSSWLQDRANSALVFELKRVVHTLKGGARMAGIRAMGDLSHELETLMGLVETGQVPAEQQVFDALQASLDELHRMRDVVSKGERCKPARALMNRIRALCGQEVEAAPEPAAPVATAAATSAAPAAPEVAPAAAATPEPVLDAAPEEVVELEDYSPDDRDSGAETDIVPTLTEIEAISEAAAAPVEPVVESFEPPVEAAAAVEADDLEAVSDVEVEFGADELGAVAPRESVRVDEPPPADTIAQHAATGSHAALDVAQVTPELPPDTELHQEEAAAEVQAPALPGREKPTQQEPREFARVDAELLDNLLNNAGEVSIFRSRMEQQVSSIEFNLAELGRTVTRLKEQLRKLELETESQILHRHQEQFPDRADFDPLEMDRYSTIQQLTRAFAESVSDVSSIEGLLENLTREAQNLLLQQSRVVTEMQNGLMRTRMVPFQRHVQRLSRLVRQVANDTNKRVELVVQGANGELDRQVLERMLPPFEHMLRNSVVHGIEMPDERVAKGKPAQGTIKVGLHREGSEMVISLEDDGRGIDVNAVRERARQRGLLQPGRVLSDEEAMQLILEPGFSTASNVTQHAGRGVGMDVVVNEIKKLGGALFTASEPGKGVKFTIRLPFTLAITQALIVRTGDELYALPLPSVEGVARISKSDVEKHLAEEVPSFNYGGQVYRLQHLGAFVGGGPSALPELDVSVPLILIRAGEHSTALVTDELVGSREMVVKSVGPQIATIRGIAGATILGDGRIVIILDMGTLVRSEWRGGKPPLESQGPKQDTRTFALVVDDSITVRRVTQRLLERNGMRVMTAKDGVDALSILQEHIPDVILLDIEMPRMDGYELATQVRADARLTDIPIVMITSRVGEKHRARAIEIGVNDYLGKPYQENQLLDAIEPLVQARKRKVS